MERKELEEYQNYIKKITDTFVSMLIYNSAQCIEEEYTPEYKRVGGKIEFEYTVDENESVLYSSVDNAPDCYDSVITRPKDVVEEWRRIKNYHAVKWLKNKIITYEEWKNR